MLCVWRGRPTECEEVVRQNVQDKLPPSNGLASSLTWPCHSPHGPCDPRPSGGARPLVCAQNAPAAPSLCRPTAGGGGAAGPDHECPASPRCRPAPPRTAATYCTHRATPRPRCVLRASVGGWIAVRGGEGWGGGLAGTSGRGQTRSGAERMARGRRASAQRTVAARAAGEAPSPHRRAAAPPAPPASPSRTPPHRTPRLGTVSTDHRGGEGVRPLGERLAVRRPPSVVAAAASWLDDEGWVWRRVAAGGMDTAYITGNLRDAPRPALFLQSSTRPRAQLRPPLPSFAPPRSSPRSYLLAHPPPPVPPTLTVCLATSPFRVP